jgi:hypothetical protein
MPLVVVVCIGGSTRSTLCRSRSAFLIDLFSTNCLISWRIRVHPFCIGYNRSRSIEGI